MSNNPTNIDVGIRANDAFLKGKEGLEWVSSLWRNFYPKAFLAAVGLIALGVALNMAGHKEWNFALTIVCIFFWGWLSYHPKDLLLWFGLGSLAGLPNLKLGAFIRREEGGIPDFDLKIMASKGAELVAWHLKILTHIALFMVVTFGTLGLFSLEQAGPVAAFFVFLIGSGFWMIVYNIPAKIYKNVTFIILIFGMASSVYAAYVVFHPQDATIAKSVRAEMDRYDDGQDAEMEKFEAITDNGGTLTPAERIRRNQIIAERDARSGHRAVVNALLDSGTVMVSLKNAKPQVIGDFPPGYVNITVNPRQVVIDGVNYWIDDYVRINGKNPKDGPILITPDHKAVLSIDFNQAGIKNTQFDAEQRLALEYKKAPL
jgi:hypothetical protein